jgi:transposase InsO family protein
MQLHANAKLGLSGRLALVAAIEKGLSLKAAAAAFSVSPATAHRWWHRWCEAGEKTRAALADRSSRPHQSPRKLSPAAEESILRARRETGFGPHRLAGIVRRARSTIWKVLHRHRVSRRPRGGRQSDRRYEWSRPGALLHLDVKKLARFRIPGHRASGVRDDRLQQRNRGSGYEYLHCVVDDCSRFAHVELHPRDDGATAAAVLARALAELRELGLDPPDAVMTDNAFAYTRSRVFGELVRRERLAHIRTPRRTPRWNGKVERFIRTLLEEWAYVRSWPNSSVRARSLSSFVRYYNRRRLHSGLGGQAPISRIHNVCGQYS